MGMKRFSKDERGQMAVEMAVLMPVILALTIITTDLMVYLDACARFDRVAPEVVRVHACSPSSSESGATAGLAGMQSDIAAGMGESDHLDFSVIWGGPASPLGASRSSTNLLSLSARPQRYVCTLNYTPWPFSRDAFGVRVRPIVHTRVYVVDPYRPGVLL